MLSRQAMRQTNAAVPIKPFVYFYGIGTPALPAEAGASLHYTVYHTSCCSYSIRHGSYLCPSPHFIHYVHVPLPLHHVRTSPDASLHGFPPATTQSNYTAGSTFHFATPTLQYSLGFIIAPLRTAFILVGFSPPAAHFLRASNCIFEEK